MKPSVLPSVVVTVGAEGADTADTTISVTEPGVVDAAVTTPPLDLPVVKPAVKVPL